METSRSDAAAADSGTRRSGRDRRARVRYGEGAASDGSYTHYMKGGVPGFYPSIKGKNNGQISLELYDPFGFGFRDKPADKRARGLKSEILNGRAAMFGIMGFLAEGKVPGSVPILSKIAGFPHYVPAPRR